MSDEGRARRRRRRDAQRAKRRIRTSRYIYRFLRIVAWPVFAFFFHPRGENVDAIRKTPRPFLLLANHASVVDPFLVSIVANVPIQYVVSDSQFRNRFVSMILGLVGAVPKTKAVSDLETVKNIVGIKRRNGIIGVFPEGQTSWDGYNLPIVKSTFKLVKSLKIPVVTAKIYGAYFAWPRWSPRPRRNSVTIRYDRVLDTQQLKHMSLEEVETFLTNKLHQNVFDDQRDEMRPVLGPHLAEYLERLLFVCPACGSFHTLRSSRRRVACSSCGHTVAVNRFGYFEQRRGPLVFSDARAWNDWQLEQLAAHVESAVRSGATILEERSVRIQRGFKTQPLDEVGVGTVRLHPDRLVFDVPGAEEISFAVRDIEGINIQNNEKLEFYVADDLFRLTTVDPRGNTYKWLKAVEFLQEDSSA